MSSRQKDPANAPADDAAAGGVPAEETTIAAPATPHGTGAVSILRLSGPRAFAIARRMTGADPASILPRTLVRCAVLDESGREIDTGLLALFPAPHSYTGEDVVELHLHGNPLLVEKAAAAACTLGAAAAMPGEFSRRAFLNGKMDLAEAEGLADLIAARTDASARIALRQLQGGIGKTVGPLRDGMAALLMRLEAAIDFADEEDIPSVSHVQVKERVSEIREELSGLVASFGFGRRLRDGATIAIAGVANVGKSLLLNRILGQERAIVTDVPGTTRDYIAAGTVLSGVPVTVVDTAGLRETDDAVEKEGVRRSREVLASADLVLFVLDGSRPLHDGDRLAYGEAAGRSHLVVLNKSDLPSAEDGVSLRGEGLRGRIRLSARTGEGVEELLRLVARELLPQEGWGIADVPLTRLRHVEAARRAEGALRRAGEAAADGLPLECVAADVREAADALAEILGAIAPEEVLDAIFGSFCVGK